MENKILFTKEEMKDILRNYQGTLRNVRGKIENLKKEHIDTDQLIMEASGLVIAFHEAEGKHGRIHKDLSDVILKEQKLLEKRKKELDDDLNYMYAYEEAVSRLYRCYLHLPNQSYEVLTRLYVKGEPYKYMKKSYGCSHTALNQKINKALQLLGEEYERMSGLK